MYRIRFHGRGGQGMKTASRILGTAFFLEGFEIQDAPRYGAERRGAPIFSYVRAAHRAINERGVITNPDLIIVADDSLIPIPAAGVLEGITENTLILINSHDEAETWKHRLNINCKILILPVVEEVEDRADLPFVGSACVGAAARLVGVIKQENLVEAVKDELISFEPDLVKQNTDQAIKAYELMAEHQGLVKESSDKSPLEYETPEWINLPFESATISAPTIHASATSVEVRTGLWRTMRPVINYDRCKHCWWVCSTICPDSAISVNENNEPEIDYDHCKGCMICVARCAPHAIETIPENIAQKQEKQTA
jgi:pyruvate ferredoxin oxidoreductase gamma subunit